MLGSEANAVGAVRINLENIGRWSVQGMKLGRIAISPARVPIWDAAMRSMIV